MADIFSENNADNQTVTAEDLVGEGRKYSNTDELAKAVAHADAFIEKLKAENAEFRGKLDAIEATEANKERVKEKEQSPLDDKPAETPKLNERIPTPNRDDFRSQIREEVEQLSQERRALENLDKATRDLADLVGGEAKAAEAIRKRAAELDVSVEWLKDAAMRSPAAFMTTMGVGGTSRNTPAPNSQMRVDAAGNPRNFEFFDKMRREDPKLYWSRENQLEMQRAAKSNPDFYKR